MARVGIEGTWRSTRVFERQRKREEQSAKGFTVFSAGMGFIIGIKSIVIPWTGQFVLRSHSVIGFFLFSYLFVGLGDFFVWLESLGFYLFIFK